ncbi:MAG TPA: LysM domain-containing protein [Chloroflexota bacterium]
MSARDPADGHDRRRPGRSVERATSRRGYRLARAEHRQPGPGTQARREYRRAPYVIGFVVVVLVLAGFLYLALSWVTGPGRVAGLGNANLPAATAAAVVAATPPAPNPTVVEQTYVVKAGDNPASIAQQFHIRVEDLIAANNIDDPQRLQIGQTLKIPPAPSPVPR